MLASIAWQQCFRAKDGVKVRSRRERPPEAAAAAVLDPGLGSKQEALHGD